MQSATDFLGTGWGFPPAFSRGGEEVLMVSREEDIFQSLQILLGTSLDERVMREEYGCNLQDYLFEELDQRLLNQLRNAITNSIRLHEPRINLEDVNFDVQADLIQAIIKIEIQFLVRSTNSRYNMVYPFYLTESVLAPAGASHPKSLPLGENVKFEVMGSEVKNKEEGPFKTFRHLTTAENTANWTARYTTLDHPLLNDHPDALIFVNAVWGNNPNDPNSGAALAHPIEVAYMNNRWAIGYRNPNFKIEAPLAFHVLIAPEGLPNAFIHTVTAESVLYPEWAQTFIDNPLTNDNYEAFLMVTPRGGGPIADRAILISYMSGIEKWKICNQLANTDKEADNLFSVGEAFNVLIVPGNGQLYNLRALDHHVRTSNKIQTGTALDFEDRPGKDGILFATLAWMGGRRDSEGFKGNFQFWYDHPDDDYKAWKEGYWFIYCPGINEIPIDILFNVFYTT